MKRISELSDEELKGFRKANLAAFYAHMRTFLAHSLDEENPVIGIHGFVLREDGLKNHFCAGGTPDLENCFAGLAALQAMMVRTHVARQIGDFKSAQSGDLYDPATGVTHCVGCDDGDPTGEHARDELERNARAWLGMTIAIAERFYGDHLSDTAVALLAKLRAEALPAGEVVS